MIPTRRHTSATMDRKSYWNTASFPEQKATLDPPIHFMPVVLVLSFFLSLSLSLCMLKWWRINEGHELYVDLSFRSSDENGKSAKERSRAARNAFISDRLLPGVYFAFLTACGLFGGFGFALGRTKKRETTTKLANQPNASKLFDDGQSLAMRALRRATLYSLTGVFSFSFCLWLISGRPTSFAQFWQWTGSWLPSIGSRKPKEEQGRTEFANLTELMKYLSDEDQRLKDEKKKERADL